MDTLDGAFARFAVCSTAAATAAKTATISGFKLFTGAVAYIKFSVKNTAANPTLNISGTGAKAIQYQGAAISSSYLNANRTYAFVYDGSVYQLIGDINTDTKYSVFTGATTSAAGKQAWFLHRQRGTITDSCGETERGQPMVRYTFMGRRRFRRVQTLMIIQIQVGILSR